MKNPKPVKILWDDSSEPGSGWMDRDDVGDWHGRTRVWSIGFVIHETKRHVTLCHSYSEDEVCGVLCIPKSAILKRKKL